MMIPLKIAHPEYVTLLPTDTKLSDDRPEESGS